MLFALLHCDVWGIAGELFQAGLQRFPEVARSGVLWGGSIHLVAPGAADTPRASAPSGS